MTVQDIARIFRVPGILLEMHDKTSSYASTEHFDLMFGKYTIRPWCKRIEAAIDRDLLGDPQYFSKFNMDALLRADTQTRTEAMKTRFMHGESSINEWRAMEGLNPIAEDWADRHFIPANLLPIEQAGQKPEPAAAPEAPNGGVGGSDNELKKASSLEPFARDVAKRVTNKEIRELPRGSMAQFRDQHRVYIYRALKPLFEAAGIEDESRREAMATQLSSQLEPDRETDPVRREDEITATIMAAVEDDCLRSCRWHVQAARLRREIDEAAASASETPSDTARG
jgi:hypothetical protein